MDMTFSAAKRSLLPQRERKTATFFTAIAVAAAFFVPFIIYGHGYFLFFGDFNVQQIPFYKMCHAAVRSGDIFWSRLTDLGSDFITSYSFYLLGSPFFWLTIPFPNWMVPYLMGPLLILKFGCAAFCAYLYIRRFTRTPAAAQVGALLYAFSGFSIYNIFFNHFHEAIIVFPLLLLSMEVLITENKRGVFALCVALSAVMNYFFFFGMVIFGVLYFVVRWASGAYKIRFSRFAALAFEAVLGVLLAAFLLLPSAYAVMQNSRVGELTSGWGAILYGKEQIYFNILECLFFPPDLPARPVFCPGANVKWSSLGAWLPVFSMTGVIAFCQSRKGHWLKRMLCISAFMAAVPVLNSLFYALNDSYYARWFYMPILLMCLATAVTMEEKDISWNSGFRWTFGITAAIAAVVGLFPQKKEGKWVFGLYTDAGDADNIYFYRFLIAVALAILGLLFCRLLISLKKKDSVRFYAASLSCVMIFSAVTGAVFLAEGSSHSYDINTVMIPQLIEGEVRLGDAETGEEYRVDFYDGVDNSGMYLGLPTIQAFHSVVSPSIMDFYSFIGVKRDVASRPDVSYGSLRDLLSVKYLLNRTGGESFLDENNRTRMPDYLYRKTDGGYYIYENLDYIPYGFSYDYMIRKSDCIEEYRDSQRCDIMLKAVVLEDEEADRLSEILTDFSQVNTPVGPTPDFSTDGFYSDENNAQTSSPELSEESASGGSEENSSETRPADASDSSGGASASSGTDSNRQEEYRVSKKTDAETLSADARHLAESSAYYYQSDRTGFTARVTREKDSLVFFSVPYSEGFTATVNGSPAEIIRANVGFMAVVVPAGDSTIRFSYHTPMLREGIILSIGALCILLIYWFVSFLAKKNSRRKEVYPEGEALLKKWCGENALENPLQDLKDSRPEFFREQKEPESKSLLDDLPEDFSGYQVSRRRYHSFSVDMTAGLPEEKGESSPKNDENGEKSIDKGPNG